MKNSDNTMDYCLSRNHTLELGERLISHSNCKHFIFFQNTYIGHESVGGPAAVFRKLLAYGKFGDGVGFKVVLYSESGPV